MTKTINLGDTVKDSITGFKGIVVAKTDWITGCTRVVVQPETLTKEGAVKPSETFDEPILVLIKSKKPLKVDRTKGGPTPIAMKY